MVFVAIEDGIHLTFYMISFFKHSFKVLKGQHFMFDSNRELPIES